jgi:hypothetical protein
MVPSGRIFAPHGFSAGASCCMAVTSNPTCSFTHWIIATGLTNRAGPKTRGGSSAPVCTITFASEELPSHGRAVVKTSYLAPVSWSWWT